ncbi:MAG TPA: tryptophan synthase subunit alpha [Cyanobacteria bacterium UBA8530]|nr:tryptophan synthase subunit alpha [Cyanobacteria bacterium UBA8530]
MKKSDRLEKLFSLSNKLFMPFLVIGDPDLETSLALSEGLIRGGADLLEFGIPFSDPPADGPVIQAADQRALLAGMDTDKAFEFLKKVRAKTEAPIALLLYYNLVFRYGVEEFYRRAAEVGVDAILIADLPVEEARSALEAAKKCGIAPIFIVSELTSQDRLDKILEEARGYLYLVARLGVTGQQKEVSGNLFEVIERLKKKSELRIFAGFGLSQPEQVREVLRLGADGAICGSAIVGRIEENLGDASAMVEAVEAFCREMKAATIS